MKPPTLKVLALADIHSPEYFRMGQMTEGDFDLVVTLGDIDVDTLDYIHLMTRGIPRFGVPGNHDPGDMPGLRSLHGTTTTLQGLTIGGFGGCPRYKDEPWHFSEKDVARVMKQMPPVDIFISHSPPLATSGDEDPVHRGFQAFDEYLTTHRPKYWLHGHLSKRYQVEVGTTCVIGVAEKTPVTLKF